MTEQEAGAKIHKTIAQEADAIMTDPGENCGTKKNLDNGDVVSFRHSWR